MTHSDEGYPYMAFYDNDYYYSRNSEQEMFGEEIPQGEPSEGEQVAHYLADDIVLRQRLCAFIPGYPHQRGYAEVTVKSILLFMPGVRISIAVDASELEEYQT